MLAQRTIAGLHDALLAELPPLDADAAILDVGCGTGAWLARHTTPARARLLVGIDRDCSHFGVPEARCHTCNIDSEDLPVDSSRFDLVTAIEVIEHLENPGRLISEAARALKPGGWLLVTTPNVHSVVARLKHLVTARLRQFDDKSDETHITPISLQFIATVWPRHGLRVERLWGFPRTGTLIARPSIALTYRLGARLFPAGVPGDTLCVLARRFGA